MGTRMEAADGFTQIEEKIEGLDRDSRDRDALLSLAIAVLQRDVKQQGSELAELKRSALRLPGTTSRSKSTAGSKTETLRR
jgi:hypothetical protein